MQKHTFGFVLCETSRPSHIGIMSVTFLSLFVLSGNWQELSCFQRFPFGIDTCFESLRNLCPISPYI